MNLDLIETEFVGETSEDPEVLFFLSHFFGLESRVPVLLHHGEGGGGVENTGREEETGLVLAFWVVVLETEDTGRRHIDTVSDVHRFGG